jgi:Fe-S-cluster containining protein
MNLNEIAKNIDNLTIGLDDTFRFHCTQCGECCTHRDDIMLNPMDVFRMAKELKMEPYEFIVRYCTWYIGYNSRVPIVCLKPVGPSMRCPMLKDNKCAVHSVKPAVCALFPLGRYIKFDPGNYGKDAVQKGKVKYLLQPIMCGDTSETHTVREWLSSFDVTSEDEFFILWHQHVAEIGGTLKEFEKKFNQDHMSKVWFSVFALLYCDYTAKEAFLLQFADNTKKILQFFQEISELEE